MMILLGASALLAACGHKGSEKAGAAASADPQSLEEVKAQAHKVQLKPGQWEGSFTMESLDMANMPGGTPPDLAEQIKRSASHAMRYCVTPEEAANPDGKIFSGQQNKDCTYSGFDASGGRIKGTVSCKSQGGTMIAAMSGSYAPDSYDMHMDMKNEGGPEGAAMTMKAKTSGKWIGAACTEK